MATDLTVHLEDRPGELARVGETLGGAGINILGGCAITESGKGQVHLLVEDAGTAREALAGAGDRGIPRTRDAGRLDRGTARGARSPGEAARG